VNRKRQRFVEEYLVDLNATQAAIRAGYKESTAYSQGQRLLKIVESDINVALAKRSTRTEITAEYVLTNLKEVVERCLQRAPVFSAKGEQIQDEEGRDVWQFYAPGANKALELLGRHLGMFNDKFDVKHSGTITHNVFDPDERTQLLESVKDE
jgi:phage terminase small subunit